ncbi:MAG: FAD-dependent thymidylate synthase [Planctomycetota bacterium]|jgi:thymidylate synthase (FAD)|nr:FAD-dependent thymidylate synthase [Planctomycetota bacterium]
MVEVEQSAELVQCTADADWLLERIARVCYNSEDRLRCSCPDGRCPACRERRDRFLAGLRERRHDSVFEHASATFRLITDRGVTHELVRHRLASYTQSSTRYIRYDEGLPVVRPLFASPGGEEAWRRSMLEAEAAYRELREAGAPPQEARDVLPTCLAATIFVTANFREWRHILKLRLARDAHPKIRVLARLVLDRLSPHCPAYFSDLGKEEESA